MRWLTLMFAFAFAMGGLWIMVGSGKPEPPPHGMASNDVLASDAASPASAPGARVEPVEEGVDPHTGQDRVELRDGVVPAPVDELVRVRVTRKGTGTPVPGAEISYLETFSTSGFSDEQLQEYARLVADVETLVQRYGKTVVADGDGMALLSLQRFGRVTARSGSLYGETFLRLVPGHEQGVHELEMERDVTLEILTVDSRGVPASGVAVNAEGGGSVLGLGTTVAPLGSLRISHAQTKLDDPDGYLLRPDILGWREGGVPYRREDPPAGPIVLRLPATGSVIVRQTGVGGEALPAGLSSVVTIGTKREPPQPNQERRETPGADGTARFDWVVAGEQYVARAFPAGQKRETAFAGPEVQGEEVRVTLALQARPRFVVGRAVDEAGEPLRNVRVRFDFDLSAGSFVPERELRTDGDGGFRVHLAVVDPDLRLRRVTIKEPPAESSARRTFDRLGVWRGDRVLVPGDNDLGDVALGGGSLVASGQIYVNGELPEGGRFALRIQGATPSVAPFAAGFLWPTDPDLQVRVDQRGRFEIRGEPRYSRYCASVSGSGYLPIAPVEFVPGQHDLAIVLDTGGSLQAEVLMDESIPAGEIVVEITPLDGQGDRAPTGLPDSVIVFTPAVSRAERRLWPTDPVVEGGRHVYWWRALWPGRYRFEVRSRGVQRPLVVVPEVMVERGENRDPRLSGIDLRGRLRQIVVTVLDPERRPVVSGRPVVLVGEAVGGELQGFGVEDGICRILTAEPSLDLLVIADGFTSKKVYGVQADTEVLLEALTEIGLRVVEGWPDRPAKYPLFLSLEKEEDAARRDLRVVYGGGGDRFVEWLGVTARPYRVAGGEVRVPVNGDGRYRVRVFMQGASRSVPLADIEPAGITVSGAPGQVFEIRVPAEAVRRAVEQVEGR